jgi:hypothetical protein
MPASQCEPGCPGFSNHRANVNGLIRFGSPLSQTLQNLHGFPIASFAWMDGIFFAPWVQQGEMSREECFLL